MCFFFCFFFSFALHLILTGKLGICGRDDLKEPLLFLRRENMVILRILHFTEAAADHEFCYYYYITMEELVNPEIDKRLILCDTRVVQSGVQLLISHRKD